MLTSSLPKIGLGAQLAQLLCYGLTTHPVAVWVAGLGIAVSSITYAAISAYASIITDKDKQVSWSMPVKHSVLIVS